MSMSPECPLGINVIDCGSCPFITDPTSGKGAERLCMGTGFRVSQFDTPASVGSRLPEMVDQKPPIPGSRGVFK